MGAALLLLFAIALALAAPPRDHVPPREAGRRRPHVIPEFRRQTEHHLPRLVRFGPPDFPLRQSRLLLLCDVARPRFPLAGGHQRRGRLLLSLLPHNRGPRVRVRRMVPGGQNAVLLELLHVVQHQERATRSAEAVPHRQVVPRPREVDAGLRGVPLGVGVQRLGVQVTQEGRGLSPVRSRGFGRLRRGGRDPDGVDPVRRRRPAVAVVAVASAVAFAFAVALPLPPAVPQPELVPLHPPIPVRNHRRHGRHVANALVAQRAAHVRPPGPHRHVQPRQPVVRHAPESVVRLLHERLLRLVRLY
mmetsp:Transcript_2902/g.6245  ORF Transcript_2902/g.6245 Transcript_2902/m.6245 type:complete len:303 (+) Transcript_2902:1546-2454(+)